MINNNLAVREVISKAPTLSPTNIAENRKGSFDFELSERLEAGLSLQGWEVKALRAGRAQLMGGYVIIRGREAWLTGLLITPLPQAARWATDADRTRKVLLKRSQIAMIQRYCRDAGRSCIPTRLYWKGRYIKVEVALAKGRKKYDKRHLIKDRDWERRKVRMKRGEVRRGDDG